MTSNSGTAAPTRVDRVFDKLKALYGANFLSKWADVDPDELHRIWSAALERYTGEEIAGALGEVLRSCPFPPNLPEFVRLCADQHQKRAAASQAAFKLPPPDSSAEAAQKREAAAAMLRSIGRSEPGREWARSARERHDSGAHRMTPSELAIVDEALRFETYRAKVAA